MPASMPCWYKTSGWFGCCDAISPDLAIHASTQMTLTSGECIRVAEELGIERVVLARELSIDEIAAIHQA